MQLYIRDFSIPDPDFLYEYIETILIVQGNKDGDRSIITINSLLKSKIQCQRKQVFLVFCCIAGYAVGIFRMNCNINS